MQSRCLPFLSQGHLLRLWPARRSGAGQRARRPALHVPLMGLLGLFTKIPSVDAASARDLIRDGAVLLDVRESGEWNAGHAPQAAHLPLSRIADAPKKVRDGKKVVVVCRSGNRSRQATKALNSMGYDAINLSGGMHAWAAAGGQVVDRSGRVGTV